MHCHNTLNLPAQDILFLQNRVAYTRDEQAYKKLFFHFHSSLYRFACKPFQKLIVMKEIDEAAKSTGKNSAIYPAKKVELTSVTYSSTDSLIAETSWLDDKMVFVNQPLEKIAQELERHFAVTILFENPRVKGYRYTGVFSNESIDKILQILQLSKNITYTVHDKDNYSIM